MAKQQFKSKDNLVFSCLHHVVFCPKCRRKFLNEPIATRLKEIVFKLAQEHGQEVLEVEVKIDYAHLLYAVSLQLGIAK